MSSISLIAQEQTNRIARSALGALLLTSLHHAYGAHIYGTPWRLHAVFVSALTAAAIAASLRALRKRAGNRVSLELFTAITLLIPVLMIGMFEGGYNHAVKDALYFGGASRELMIRLFPAPAYEMPNDVFFEVTGVLQLIAGIRTARDLYRFVKGVSATSGPTAPYSGSVCMSARGRRPFAASARHGKLGLHPYVQFPADPRDPALFARPHPLWRRREACRGGAHGSRGCAR